MDANDDDHITCIIRLQWVRLLLKKQQAKYDRTENNYVVNVGKVEEFKAPPPLSSNGERPGTGFFLSEKAYLEAAIETADVYQVHKTPTQLVPVLDFYNLPKIPKMTAWLPLQRNVLAKNEPILSHIPWITDDAVKDPNWHDELLQLYDNKLHLADEDGFTDAVLAELVDVLTSNVWTRGGRVIRIDQQTAFKHIAAHYKINITPKGVQEKYDAYQKYKRGEPLVEETIPNIDGPQDVVYSREKALHSYQSHFCRRCFVYECGAHKLPDESSSLYKPPDEDYSTKKVCGEACFLYIDTVTEGSIIASTSTVKQFDAQRKIPLSTIKTDHWTNSEMTLLNVLQRTYQGNYCAISRILGNKTCAEVYAIHETSFNSDEKTAIMEQIKNDMQCMQLNRKLKKQRKPKSSTAPRTSTSLPVTTVDGGGQENNELNPHYVPCYHPGVKCLESLGKQCPCMKNGTSCEKFCNCTVNCSNRFSGCHCRTTCNTKACPCFIAARECDPDLCKSCGAAEPDLLEQRDKYKCVNVSIQRGLWKQMKLAISTVAGWGAFLLEDVAKGELISEYCGEVISQVDADRKGKIYDRCRLSYLFNLTSKRCIDSKRMGNMIRFANHSVEPNCHSRVMLVNGEHRIGIYANCQLSNGDELFLDYRYEKNAQLSFVSIERPGVVVVAEAEDEAEEEEDEEETSED